MGPEQNCNKTRNKKKSLAEFASSSHGHATLKSVILAKSRVFPTHKEVAILVVQAFGNDLKLVKSVVTKPRSLMAPSAAALGLNDRVRNVSGVDERLLKECLLVK